MLAGLWGTGCLGSNATTLINGTRVPAVTTEHIRARAILADVAVAAAARLGAADSMQAIYTYIVGAFRHDNGGHWTFPNTS